MATASQEVTQGNVKVRVFLKGIGGTSHYVVFKITTIERDPIAVTAAHQRYIEPNCLSEASQFGTFDLTVASFQIACC